MDFAEAIVMGTDEVDLRWRSGLRFERGGEGFCQCEWEGSRGGLKEVATLHQGLQLWEGNQL
jgi:hypothetical protein